MTRIEWTDTTWNPIRGCSRISEGCRFCYAETMASRFSGPRQPYEGLAKNGRWTGEVRLVEEHLEDPLGWKRPRRIFVNSMSDLFHEDLAPKDIGRVFAVMRDAPAHTFQVLTKRAALMRETLTAWAHIRTSFWPLPNVHIGVSVEDARVLHRVDDLRETPAALRWLSCEPLIGPLDGLDLTGIGWVVVGGESGQHARPLKLEWVRDIIRRCREADVPVFVKQLGSNYAAGRGKGGDPSGWPEDLRVREWPSGHAAPEPGGEG